MNIKQLIKKLHEMKSTPSEELASFFLIEELEGDTEDRTPNEKSWFASHQEYAAKIDDAIQKAVAAERITCIGIVNLCNGDGFAAERKLIERKKAEEI